jgi:uncharacterized glyoxalase superfamily protein PhnB
VLVHLSHNRTRVLSGDAARVRACRAAEMPIADQLWGDYYGSLKDKFWVMWMVNYGTPREE